MLREFLRSTRSTTSHVRVNTPFSRNTPNASIRFYVSRKGTISGTFSSLPFSKMQSKSTCVNSPVPL